MTVETAAQAAYIVAALLFILALAGLSHHESAKLGNTFGIAGMTVALVATIALAIDRDISGARPGAAGGGDAGRGRDRAVAGPGGRDDRDARADRPAALLRGSGRGAGRLERLPARRGRPRRRRGRCPADAGPDRDPLRRGLHRCVHRRGHVHRLGRGIPQAVGADQVQPADAARQERAEPRRPGRRSPRSPCGSSSIPSCGCWSWSPRSPSRSGWHLVASIGGGDMPVVVSMLNSLLGLGRGGFGLPARERPADHHRRARRLLRCLPVLHHVQGDEPLVHLRHRWRLRHRGRPVGRHRLRRAPRDHRRGRRRAARRLRTP